jgi:HAD superfamily hydrolase (TIGR01509 family)
VTTGAAAANGLASVRAISFDFGNTLVPVTRKDLGAVVRQTTTALARHCGPFDETTLAAVWDEERERQFAEDVPRMREVDLAQRTARVLARMRGMPAPDRASPWDDEAARGYSTPAELDFTLTTYTEAFVAAIPPPPAVGPMLERLADRFTLGICSNWPLSTTIERFVEAAGWTRYLRAIVVSERVGTIKPDVRIFRVAEAALGTPPEAILHIGDDWAADVVGAKRAGWLAAYLVSRTDDSPFPTSRRDDRVDADLRCDRLADLELALA